MIADHRWRDRLADARSRRRGDSGAGAASGATDGVVAALAVGFAAIAPACAVRFDAGHAPAAVAAVLITTIGLVVLFAAATMVIVGRIEQSGGRSLGADPSSRQGRWRFRVAGSAIGAVGGLAIAGAVIATGPAVGVAVGTGIASAAVASLAYTAGIEFAHRRIGRGLAPGASRPRVRGWFVVAGVLIGVAVAIRHAGPVGADLVPYVVAGAIASGTAGELRPVARWIGWRAVRVTEAVPDRQLDVTVRSTDDERPAGASEVADQPAVVAPSAGRFARAAIAAAGYLARRRDLDLIVALAVAAVVITGAATLTWTSGVTARHDRAAIELGADRVLTVAPIPPTRLIADVRAADPAGRFAMAAAIVPATGSSGTVVAVDGQRYAAVVAGVRPGPTSRQLAALLRPKRMPATKVTGATMQLNVITSGAVGPAVTVAALLRATDGVTRSVAFGPLRSGEHVYAAAAPCPLGCTVIGFTVGGPPASTPVVSVVLRELRQRTPDRAVLDPTAFADATRWRLGDVSPSGAQNLAVSGAGLDIAVAGTKPAAGDGAVVYLDAGVPIAAVAGPDPAAGWAGDLTPGPAGPIKVTRIDAPVPGVPADGILVDLAAVAPSVRTTSQVWLAADAPPSLVDDLATHGLRVLAATSIGERAAHYADQPATAVARIQLLAGLVMLCCAALVLGAVTRAHRGLRTVARGVGLVTTVWAFGVVGALAARHAGPDFVTGFVDGWARVPPPPLVAPLPFALFALVSAVVLAAPVALVAARRRPRPRVVDPPGPSQPRGDRPDTGCVAVSDGPQTVHR
jgi:hypothetical protein